MPNIIINEFSCENEGDYVTNPLCDHPDFIDLEGTGCSGKDDYAEITNITDYPIDLTGWVFSDCKVTGDNDDEYLKNEFKVPNTKCAIDTGWVAFDLDFYSDSTNDTSLWECGEPYDNFGDGYYQTVNGGTHPGPPELIVTEVGAKGVEYIKLTNSTAGELNLLDGSGNPRFKFTTQNPQPTVANDQLVEITPMCTNNFGSFADTCVNFDICQDYCLDGVTPTHSGADCCSLSPMGELGDSVTLYQHAKPAVDYFFDGWPGVKCYIEDDKWWFNEEDPNTSGVWQHEKIDALDNIMSWQWGVVEEWQCTSSCVEDGTQSGCNTDMFGSRWYCP